MLDYEDEEAPPSPGGFGATGTAEETGRRLKKPWLYRWPDLVRDEVLARLLKLNADRAEQEKLSGGAAEAAKARKMQGKKSAATPAQRDLLPSPQKDFFG